MHVSSTRRSNVTFPLDRLQELVKQGSLGSLSQQHYSFMGAIRNPRRLIEESGPAVARRLLDEAVEVVLLTPT